MSSVVVLRPVDADRCAALHAGSISPAWSPADFDGFLSASTSLGFAIETQGDLEAIALCQRAGDRADVLTLATAPVARRLGHARRLLRSLDQALGERGVTTLTLDVAADNLPALALYRTMGFTEDGIRSRYYRRKGRTPMDAVLMSKLIGRSSGHLAETPHV